MSRIGTIAPRDLHAPWELAGMPKETPVLLALSGGADSRALLHLLAERAKTDAFSLTLAHVDHGIRGEEASRDREFCRALAKEYGVEICILNADVPSLAAKHGTGLEEEARRVRYAYFEELMRERGIPLLATAHHADDNLETVLFHLCRGTGLGGLRGILPTRPFANGYLTRPLLQMTRREIQAFCEEHGLQYVTDSTNADTAYTRNRIRAEVVPVLESLFDRPQHRVAEMSQSLCEDASLLSSLSRELLENAREPQGLSVARLQNAPVPLAKRALMAWCKEQTGGELERVHVEALLSLIQTQSTEARVALPKGAYAAVEFGVLRLLPRESGDTQPFCVPLCLGETLLEDGSIRIKVEKLKNLPKVNNLSTQSYLILNVISDIMKRGFCWRTRLPGDTLLMGGMHRKLRKLYGAAGVPVRWRERMPLLCDAEGVVWAPFVGSRDEPTADGGTAYLLTVELISLS